MGEQVAANAKVDILLVDDRPEGLFTLGAVLNSPQYRLVKVGSGAAAIAAVNENDFAVILLDVQMPGLDGFETAAIIKKRPESRDIPIIFVTAISKEDGFIYKGYEAGAVDYLFKPFDPEILKAKVAVFVELHRKNKKIREQSESLVRLERLERERERAKTEIENLIRYRRLSDNMPIVVCNADSEGQMTFFNEAWRSYTGLSSQESNGDGWRVAFDPDDLDICLDVWKQATRDRSPFKVECRIRRAKDSSFRWHLIRGVPEIDQDGLLVGWVGTATEVHDQKVALEERTRLLEREKETVIALERSNRDLEQFAYIASHDLSEPLRTVAAYSQLVEKKYSQHLDSSGKEYIQYITEGATRMRGLLADILAYSKLNLDNEALQELDCDKILATTLSDLRAAISESHAKITSDPLPRVLGNRAQMRQLFQNLIGNAVKFRNKEDCKIHISAHMGHKQWVFSVNDNGIGIQLQYSKQIFNVFKRLHSRQEYEGNGIGLAICKKIIEKHGGMIWIESEVGKGSTFFFTIPDNRLDKDVGEKNPQKPADTNALALDLG